MKRNLWVVLCLTIYLGAFFWMIVRQNTEAQMYREIISSLEQQVDDQDKDIKVLRESLERVKQERDELKFRLKNITPISRGGTMRYSLDDVRLVARVVHAEASGEPEIGQMLVARVVFNRVEANPGMTVHQIVHNKNAFAVAPSFNQEDMAAVTAALNDTQYRGVFTFFNPDTATNQEFVKSKMGDVVIRIGGHVFCE